MQLEEYIAALQEIREEHGSLPCVDEYDDNRKEVKWQENIVRRRI